MSWLTRVLAESRRVALALGAVLGALLAALSGLAAPAALVLQTPCVSSSNSPPPPPLFSDPSRK